MRFVCVAGLLRAASLVFAEGEDALAPDDVGVGTTVQTSSGPITGHAAKDRLDISEYLGIPYAQAPLGPLRFAAPQKFTSTTPFDAAVFSPDCPGNIAPLAQYPNATPAFPRVFGIFTGQGGNAQSEDCLTLNIWAKRTGWRNKRGKRGKSGKPVLLWIYGGRFNIGNSNNAFYQGQYLADKEDVVVVTINYRVNIFGFSGAPGETQNVGLLDQRMAIEWVRDNIAAFGGDPRRITIFGQSAGGVSVDYYSFIWLQDPIVSGLISQSGTAFSFNPNTAEQSTAYFYQASSNLGCGDAGDVLECMRAKDFREILNAIRAIPPAPSPALAQPIFQPTIDNQTVFADYESLAMQGQFIRAPYLAGNTDYEAGFYQVAAFAGRINLNEDQWDLFNLAGFTCATARAVEHRVRERIPTWRYRYFAEFPNLRLYPGSGAFHGSEIPMIFDTAPDISLEPNTPEQEALSDYMMSAWAAFARDPRAGLTGLGWPEYNPQGETLVRLGFNGDAQASFVAPAPFDARCDIVRNDVSYAQGAF